MELKKGSGRKLIMSGAPKRLWNDCLELESYVRSNTAHGINKLDGEVPNLIMSEEMSDIGQFCEFEPLKWIMFWDETVPYPNDHFILGRYLDMSIDVGPTLMVKNIKENDQIPHISPHIKQ